MVADVVLGAGPNVAVAMNPSTGKLEQNAAGEHDHATVLFYRVAPDAYPAGMKDDTVEGIARYMADAPDISAALSTGGT